MSGICEHKPSVVYVTPEQVEYLRSYHPTNYKNLCRMIESGKAEQRIPPKQEEDAFERYKSGKKGDVPVPEYERGK